MPMKIHRMRCPRKNCHGSLIYDYDEMKHLELVCLSCNRKPPMEENTSEIGRVETFTLAK